MFALNRLKYDSFNRKPMLLRCVQGTPNADIRPVDGFGHEVDGQECVKTQSGCAGDSDLPAVLVKLIFRRIIDSRQNSMRGLTVRATHERLAGEHGVGAYIDDWLKCE